MSEEVYRNAYIKVQRNRRRLMEQNKRYREALIYVTKARIEQYHDFENMLEDIKFVVNKTLEDESK